MLIVLMIVTPASALFVPRPAHAAPRLKAIQAQQQLPNIVTGVVELSNGNVVVAGHHGNSSASSARDGLHILSPTGTALGQFPFFDARGLAVGASGTLYLTDSAGRLLGINQSSFLPNRLNQRPGFGSVTERTAWKVPLAVDEARAEATFASTDHSAVEVYDLPGVFGVLGTLDAPVRVVRPTSGRFERVRDLTLDTVGNLWVLDGTLVGNRVYRFDANGVQQASFAVPGNGIPRSIGVGVGGQPWVVISQDVTSSAGTDLWACAIQFNGSGTVLQHFGGDGLAAGSFLGGNGIGQALNGELLVGGFAQLHRYSSVTGSATTPCNAGGLS